MYGGHLQGTPCNAEPLCSRLTGVQDRLEALLQKFNYSALHDVLLRHVASIFSPKKVNSLTPADIGAIMGVEQAVEARRAALKTKLTQMTDAVAEAKAFYASQPRGSSRATKGRSFTLECDGARG